MDSWLEPIHLGFMQNAYLAIILVGVICGVTGVFVILRGLAFMGDALSHAIFPGVVIAFLLGGNFLVGALIAAILVSLGIGAVSQSPRLSNDTTIGVFFVGAFAFGIALISAQKTYTRDLNTFLLGSILGVSRNDLYLTAIVGAIVLGIILLLRRELTIVAFDRTFAKATGLNLWLYDQIFLILLSLGDRDLAADRRQHPGAGHARHPGGDSTPAHRPPSRHARCLGVHRRAVRRCRPDLFLSRQHRLGRERRARRHGILPDRVSLLAQIRSGHHNRPPPVALQPPRTRQIQRSPGRSNAYPRQLRQR